MDSNVLNQWDEAQQAASPITTQELDELANKYWEATAVYEEAKKQASDLYKKANELEGKFVEALEQAGKQKYHVEGIGTFSFVDRQSVQTPKTVDDKQALAKYLEQKGGKVLFWSMFGINSQTLQSFYRGEFEEYKQRVEESGTPGEQFGIPGIGAPTNMRSLRLQKEKKK